MDGRTALHLACEQGNVSTIQTLLSEGADSNCEDDNGVTPLHIVTQNNWNTVRGLLCAKDASIGDYTSEAWQQATGIIRSLLPHKNDSVYFLENDSTASRASSCVDILLAAGADSTILDNEMCKFIWDRWYFWDFEVGRGVLRIVTEEGRYEGLLYVACAIADYECVKRILQNTTTTAESHIPHVPHSWYKNSDVFVVMVEDKLRRAAQGPADSTLHLACLRGEVSMTKLLLDYQAPINAVNKDGRAPIYYARKFGYAEIVDMLRERGAGDSMGRPLPVRQRPSAG